jgi:beta-galactosidase
VEKSGKIKVGEILFVPADFVLPPDIGEKQSGELSLEANVGENRHADTFAFRVFPPVKPLAGSVKVFDFSGETTAMLKKLGLQTSPWDGSKGGLLVVGRKAFSSGRKSPGNLEAFARDGGQVLIMEQDPAWIKTSLGLRICELLTRRVFTMDKSHPVVAGLDSEDLRDWKGSSTLVDPKPDYTQPNIPRNSTPTWGWRWGSRGTVTTTAIEKPHRAGWRPLLECQFDLAYSPLMEITLGKGRVVLCTLDLEDHASLDPAAASLARNIISWMQTAVPDPAPAPALYVGDDEGALLLDLIGANYTRSEKVDSAAPLVILGPDISADLAEPILAAGGKVLVLPRRKAGPAGLGVSVAKNDRFGGSLNVPAWNEARGLSPSDLRWRANGSSLLLSGGETGGDGLMARVVRGKGVVIFTQSDPLILPADQKQYFRYTRWRMTRALAQLVSNLGGTFALDNRIFNPGSKQISLAGSWKADWTKKMPVATAPFPDFGITAEAKTMVKAGADESKMKEVVMPGYWSEMASADGEAVLRRHFTLPKELAGQDLILNLGAVDDFDETFVNGTKVGGIGGETKNYWRAQRIYKVPATLLKEGDNVVAVRIFDNYTTSGIVGPANRMHIGPDEPEAQSFYHPDYRTDFPLGDDPYRYYRW